MNCHNMCVLETSINSGLTPDETEDLDTAEKSVQVAVNTD